MVGDPDLPGGIGFDYRLAMSLPDLWISLLKEAKDELLSQQKPGFTGCTTADLGRAHHCFGISPISNEFDTPIYIYHYISYTVRVS